jgi:6,7-dimethyl-8-ribityllumazine synthase
VRSYPTHRDGSGLRIGIVVARFNHLISARLLEAAAEELAQAGTRPEDVHVAWVPGAFEIPLAARVMAQSGRYHALVTLGAVIRGGTPHFDYVCRGVTDGLRDVMQRPKFRGLQRPHHRRRGPGPIAAGGAEALGRKRRRRRWRWRGCAPCCAARR